MLTYGRTTHAQGQEAMGEGGMMMKITCILVLFATSTYAQTNTGILSGGCKDVASFITYHFGLNNKPSVTSSAADRTVTMTYFKPETLSIMLLVITRDLCAAKVTAINHASEGPLVNALKVRFHK
jgi:hypothetical protein